MTRLAMAFLLLTAGAASAQEARWQLDSTHSHIGFTARHLAFAKVRGKFTVFSAPVVKADAKTGKLTALEAEAETASVDTGNGKRDSHLRADDFFAADKHPKLKLKLKSIKWKGNKFTANTALTIRGVTKDVPFKGELLGVRSVDFGQGAHQRAAYEATATIDRRDFGLDFNGLAEGVSLVGDEVEIELAVEIAIAP